MLSDLPEVEVCIVSFMARLNQILDEHASLDPQDRLWIERLVREWHLLSDTSFSDLVLWIPDRHDDNVFWACAQVRPVTGPTALEEDVTATCLAYEFDSLVSAAYLSGEVVYDSGNNLLAGIPVDVEAIPILRCGRCIAVLERHTNQMGVRAPGALEDAYMSVATSLCDMVHHGIYPVDPPSDLSISPKVGDGIIVLEPDNTICYASPNAVSMVHRVGASGDLLGESIERYFTHDAQWAIPATEPTDVTACEFSLEEPDLVVRMRVIPLFREGQLVNTLVACRDITQLVERERELVNKDATIREIHHRVKNNLQTVAALLRLQSRRMGSLEAKYALRDAQRRVQSIAAVHEILSQGYDDAVEFDAIADRILHMIGDLSSTGSVQVIRQGSFGALPGSIATSLSLIMTELCQNAVEHGLASNQGIVMVKPQRVSLTNLILDVIDEGVGLPEDFDLAQSSSLGLSIVTTLVSDLDGSFELVNNAERGSTARAIVSWGAREPESY